MFPGSFHRFLKNLVIGVYKMLPNIYDATFCKNNGYLLWTIFVKYFIIDFRESPKNVASHNQVLLNHHY